MSTGTLVAQSQLDSYAQSIARFQAASAGRYGGPSMPLAFIRDMMSTVDGLDTKALVNAVSDGAGQHRLTVASKGGGLVGMLGGFLVDFVISLGAGAVWDYLSSFKDEQDKEADAREGLVKDAQRCADAIDDTVHTSDTAIAEILNAASQLIDVFAGLLMRTGNPLVDAITPVVVSVASGIIENANATVSSTCRDRDTTIEQCYVALESLCDSVCSSTPAAPPAVEASTADANCATAASTAPAAACDASAAQASASSTANTMPAAAAVEAVSSAAPVAEAAASALQPAPQPALQPVAHVSEGCPNIEAVCSGVLGAVGVGVAVLGIGALAVAATQAFEEFTATLPAATDIPQPCEVPAAEPAPAQAPAAAPAVEVAQGVTPPPAELSQVEEPPAPAQKIAHTASPAAPAAPVAAPAAPAAPVAESAAPAAPVAAPAAPAAESSAGSSVEQGSSIRARKGGQW